MAFEKEVTSDLFLFTSRTAKYAEKGASPAEFELDEPESAREVSGDADGARAAATHLASVRAVSPRATGAITQGVVGDE